MVDVFTGARDVSYLKNVLPLTRPLLQGFENGLFEIEQRRSHGSKTTRQVIKTAAFLAGTAVVGIPEIVGSFVSYTLDGFSKGCNWR
jgi:hypothetical protein